MLGRQVVDGSGADELAVGDDDHVVDGLFHLSEHVTGDQDRLALTAEVA